MYKLMCKDNICATFDLVKNIDYCLCNLEVAGVLPLGCKSDNFMTWVSNRNATKHRSHLQRYLRQIGCNDIVGFLNLTHGISINDCYWICEENEDLHWADVSLYSNEFDEIVQKLSFCGEGSYSVQLSSISPEFGTNGAFDKCWRKENGNIYLYKRGSDIASNSGLEPYCEVLASQVFSKMSAGIPYRLVKFHDRIASRCKLFNDVTQSFVAYGNFATSNSIDKIINFYESIDSADGIKRLLVCDALTLNTDRHAGNHGVLVDSETQKILCMAPGFDYNLSMLPYVTRDEFYNVSEAIQKQTPKCYSDFIDVARKLLTPSIRADLINLKGIELVLPDDEKFPKERVKWMSEIVNYQIKNVLSDTEPIYPTLKVEGLSNLYRYHLKYNMTEEEFRKDIPRLMKLYGISHMSELEEAIVDMLD